MTCRTLRVQFSLGVSTRWSAKSEVQRESAERQVQKGECRKASADKEPTQDANTLGGSDHVRIYTYIYIQVARAHGLSHKRKIQ